MRRVWISPATPDVMGDCGWRKILIAWQNSTRLPGWSLTHLGNPGSRDARARLRGHHGPLPARKTQRQLSPVLWGVEWLARGPEGARAGFTIRSAPATGRIG